MPHFWIEFLTFEFPTPHLCSTSLWLTSFSFKIKTQKHCHVQFGPLLHLMNMINPHGDRNQEHTLGGGGNDTSVTLGQRCVGCPYPEGNVISCGACLHACCMPLLQEKDKWFHKDGSSVRKNTLGKLSLRNDTVSAAGWQQCCRPSVLSSICSQLNGVHVTLPDISYFSGRSENWQPIMTSFLPLQYSQRGRSLTEETVVPIIVKCFCYWINIRW